MRLMQVLDVTGAVNGNTFGPLPTGFNGQGCQTLYLMNMSQMCYEVTFESSPQYTGHLPSNWARPFKIKGQCDRVTIMATNNPVGVANPPFSHIAIESYLANEDVTHLVDQGIPIQPPLQSSTVTVAQQVQNDGNAPGTVFVESTPTGGSGSATSITNDGIILLKILIASVYHQIMKTQTTGNPLLLGQAGDVLEMLGQLKVDQAAEIVGDLTEDGALTVTGDATFNGASPAITSANDIYITGALNRTDAGTIISAGGLTHGILSSDLTNTHINASGAAGQLLIDVGGVTQASVQTDGLHMASGNKVIFGNAGSVDGVTTGTVSIGASSAVTVTHGVGSTPSFVLMTTDQATSSGTNSAYSYTSTQFTAFNGAGATLIYRWVAWH